MVRVYEVKLMANSKLLGGNLIKAFNVCALGLCCRNFGFR